MSWPLFETLAFAATVLFLLYYYAKSKLQHWEKRGVKGPKPLPFFGNFKDLYFGKASINDCFVRAYYEFKDEPLIGMFNGHLPVLILRDLDIIKDVLIKDFPTFADRFKNINTKFEPFADHMFRLDGKRWKPLRSHFSPVFSSGKLKEMFRLITECGNQFEEYLNKKVGMGMECIDCREIAAKYTTDVIGSCAFGIEANALAAEDCEFRKMGRRIFQTSFKTFLTDRLRRYPFLLNIFGRFIFDTEIVDFFTKITKDTIDYRIKHNFRRHDFVDALVELKQNPEKIQVGGLSDTFLTAQAFIFFAAGFETSSVTITNALYELALNQSIQDAVRSEIKDTLQRSNGEITYENIKEMKLLDAVLQETLRKYPVVLWLSRTATDDYTFSKPKVTIPNGTFVVIPVYAMQHDPENFPNPEVFDPNRFLDKNENNRHQMLFLPFGDGPRNCIGLRFAKIQTKIGIIKVLSNFKVDVCDETVKSYEIDRKALFLLQPAHKIYLRITKV